MTIYYTQWSLGDLLHHAQERDADTTLQIDPYLFSYRGYYEHAAFTHGETTAGELVDAITSRLGQTMTGYKGGEFDIRKECLVFVTSDESATGSMLLGFTPEGEPIVCGEAWL